MSQEIVPIQFKTEEKGKRNKDKILFHLVKFTRVNYLVVVTVPLVKLTP